MANEFFLFLVPLIAANIIHHFLIIPKNTFSFLARPVDCGRSWKNIRIFGDAKTYRGFVVVPVLTAVFCGVLADISAVSTDSNPFFLGFMLGIGYMAAELPNSFVKRRLGILPGKRGARFAEYLFSFADHADSVLGAAVILYFLESSPLPDIMFLALIGISVHFALDFMVHLFGYKKYTQV